LIDVYSSEFLQDPYPYYSEFRSHHPVFNIGNDWVIARYKDVTRVLTDWRTFSARKRAISLENLFERQTEGGLPGLNVLDPPEHSRLRRPISAYFSGPRIAGLETEIETIAGDLIEKLLRKTNGDVVTDVGGPLAAITTSRILGLNPEHFLKYKTWTEASLYYKDLGLNKEDRSRIRKEFRQFFVEFWEQVKNGGGKGILNELNGFTEEETILFGMFLLIAGSESTGNFLGNAVNTVLKHRDVLQTLIQNPALIRNFIESTLRYDGPVKTLVRVSTRDVELSGVTIPEGCRVVALIGSANRDPEVFEDPDRFRLEGENIKHLSFGGGAHYCPGDDLARMQAEIVLRKLIPLLAELPPVDLHSLEYRSSVRARGLKHLPLPFHCIRGGNKRA